MLDSNLLERIKKVAALTDSPNEHEAAAAAEKLQAMLAEHNLSMTDLGVDKVVSQIVRDNDFLTYFAGWIKPLLNTTAKLYFCYYYYESFPSSFINSNRSTLGAHIHKLYVGSNSRTYLRHNFIGEEHNVVVARYMGEYLISAMEKLCREASKLHQGNQADKSSFRYSFMNACAAKLCARLTKRMVDSANEGIKENGTNLPALLSLYQTTANQNQAFMEGEDVKVKTKSSMVQIKNAAGAKAGLEAGDKIGLEQQIEGDNNHKRISGK